MFVERDTGARRYFEVPLARAAEIFRQAFQGVSGLARTVRGPFMSTTPGKVLVDGGVDRSEPIEPHAGQKITIRLAAIEDMASLLALEEACWAGPLRATEEEIRGRIERFPEGQRVLVLDGRLVGAIYAQRIDDIAALARHNFRSVAALHRERGGFLQLLAVNVFPSEQLSGFGDELLSFMLAWARSREDLSGIVAVTLCKSYGARADVRLEDYIATRNEEGLLVDPILRFHELHGARIEGLLPEYRPEDAANRGSGVLVRYEVSPPPRAPLSEPAGAVRQTAVPEAVPEDEASVQRLVEAAVRSVLGKERADAYSPERAVMDMGLDSLDLYSLRKVLSEQMGRPVGPTDFFRYPSPAALSDHLLALATPRPSSMAHSGQEPEAEAAPRREGAKTQDTRQGARVVPAGRRSTESPSAAEAIAIIGAACRFPGAEDLDAYWTLLREGRDAIRAVPEGRWDARALADLDCAEQAARWRGGFLDEIDQFDAPFFHITAREANALDPQQRILLELNRAALENAGVRPESLAGSRTGVFVGLFSHDYEYAQLRAGEPADFGPYFSTGNSASLSSGRLAYVLGLHGPTLTVDTACSSSLVALHLACQSLATGESDLALVSAVNLMLSPELFLSFSRAGMLSPQGRCATFAADADGYVRGEGCGVVVLKRLSAALADGDPIWGVVRGTAINHDGASNGLTAPNGLAQERVIRAALAAAGVAPRDIAYVEAHGTGTTLGDAVELRALSEVFGADRPPDAPLWIGSVKTNIGHTEAAAGMAGLIKVLLAMRHRALPKHLHYHAPNREVDPDRVPARIPLETCPFPGPEGAPLRAGISSFGISGTNAHVIVEEPPLAEPAGHLSDPVPGEPHLFALSAKTGAALKRTAQRITRHLRDLPATRAVDLCRTLAVGRSHFDHRLALVGDTTDELCRELERALPSLADTKASASTPKIAWLFSGQGSQYEDMGRTLYEREPAFRDDLDRCAALLSGLDVPLAAIMFPGSDRSGDKERIHQTIYTQPALFALEYALARQWQRWGLEPDVVMGHSVGEYAAACVAGVFSLDDGLKLIAARARLMQALPGKGAMAAVLGDEATVLSVLAGMREAPDVAAYNGPEHVVLSGTEEAVARALSAFSALNIRCAPLQVSHAFHSAQMEPMLVELYEVARSIRFEPPRLPFCENVTGAIAGARVTTPEYWVEHARRPVHFRQGMATLDRMGCAVFLEIGPKPVLVGMGRRCVPPGGGERAYLPSLRPGQDDRRQMLTSLSQLYALGFDLNWEEVVAGRGGRRVPLPTYAYDRNRYWIAESRKDRTPTAAPERLRRAAESPDGHPLLGSMLDTPLRERVFRGSLGAPEHAYLEDHRVAGAPIFPAAAFVEMGIAAARACSEARSVDAPVLTLASIVIARPLRAALGERRELQTIATPAGEGSYRVEIFSNAPLPSRWIAHASLTVTVGDERPATSAENLTALRAAIRTPVPRAAFASAPESEGAGLELGPRFQGIAELWQDGLQALGCARLPASLLEPSATSADARMHVHPVLLDACFQVAAFAVRAGGGAGARVDAPFYLLMGIDRFTLLRAPSATVWSHARAVDQGDGDEDAEVRAADVDIYDESGAIVASARGLLFKRADLAATAERRQAPTEGLYEVEWSPAAFDGEPAATADLGPLATVLTDSAPAAGERLFDAAKLLSELDSVCRDFIVEALCSLGFRPQSGDFVSADALAEQLGIVERHLRLTNRLLHILAEDEVLAPCDGAWRVITPPAPRDGSARALQRLLQGYPAARRELELLARCGSALSQVLRGEHDPLGLLFPDGNLTGAADLYEDSASFSLASAAVASAVSSILRALPSDRPLRVLEIGAGTGGTTAHILPVLWPRCREYVFTDVTAFFAQRVKQRFAAYPSVRFQVLDIERDPAAQGALPHSFDLVVAANVLHATADLKQSLEHVRELLAPGGVMLLLEGSAPRRWIDLTFGLTEGWWRFTDTSLRPAYPLLTPEQWARALAEAGWEEPASLPASPEDRALFPQAIIAAKAPLAPAAKTSNGIAASSLHWLLLADRGGASEALADRLADAGHVCTLVYAGGGSAAAAAGRLHVDPAAADGFARLFEAISPPQVIVHAWSLDAVTSTPTEATALHQDLVCLNASALHLITAVAAAEWPSPPALRVITRGAQRLADDTEVAPTQQTLWGLTLVMNQEHPELDGQLLDLPAGHTAAEIEPLYRWLTGIAAARRSPANPRETRVAYRDGHWFVPRLVHAPISPPSIRAPATPILPADASYLVTGGLGGLGLRAARHLVSVGARHLVLLGRRAPSPEVKAHLAAIEADGARIHCMQADVADAAALARVFEHIDGALPPLRGVLHAAGVFEDRVLVKHEFHLFEKVFAAKVWGSWNLHQLTKARALDFFVLFSSAMTAVPTPGLSNYVAANLFLDGLAQARRGAGLPGVSVGWGPWEGLGMARAVGSQRAAQWSAFGLQTSSPEDALAILELCIAPPTLPGSGLVRAPNLWFMRLDWRAFAHHHGERAPSFFERVLPREAAPLTQPIEARTMRAHLVALPPSERRAALKERLRAMAAAVMGLTDPAMLSPTLGFFQQGMDSLSSMDLRGRIQGQLELPLPQTVIFKHPTVEQLGEFLYQSVFAQSDAVAPPPRAGSGPKPPRSSQSDEIVFRADWSAPLELDPSLELDISRVCDPMDPELDAELVKLERLLRNVYV
jgi:acyl transferase domain-containing protein/acyl carrier protein